MENARLLGELRARTDEIAALNRELEARVAAQLGELERMGRLKRFLAPQLAEMIVARGAKSILSKAIAATSSSSSATCARVSIAQGYATLGEIGFAERVDYTAIGTVCNLAARLCAEAQGGQILVSGRIAAAIEDGVRVDEIGDLALKGLSQAVAVYNVAGARSTP